MALRRLFKDTEPVLRKKSKPVEEFDEKLHQLLDDMYETMLKNDGIGLAAVQVGVLKRVFIVEVNNMFLELINPEIISQDGEQVNEEGCLSVDKYGGMVKRPAMVGFKAQDRFGNPFMISGTGYLAVALCHENDHLDGVLFTDKAERIFEKEIME